MAAPMVGKFDGNLCDILQNVQQIDTFLDVIFEFLYRRTDFYKSMRHQHDTMGLPPGMARRLVMQTFMKYEKIGQGPQLSDLQIQEPGVPEPMNTVEITEMTETADSTTEKAKKAETETREETPADTKMKETQAERKTSESNTDVTKPKTGDRHIITESDTYNGALRDNYAWSQTLGDVDLKVFVPETLRKAKDLTVDIREDHVKVAVKGQHTGASEPQVLLDGKLTMKVRCDQSMWSLHPGHYVQLSLEKQKETWWRAIVEGEPPIDNKSIDNVQNVSEMDEEAQQDYRRVMFDMEQKRLGKPTSKEMETHDILRKAWDAEGSPFKGTEFDPSTVNIST
ncbi:nudC domain-containing protein 3-like isoform X2 [Patiria miniata]|uniref:CS domain-containing protein n=1 Tax=Patiria miniata TaxID=46514 RepID=A0A914B1B0_PATMI|nr:nudC domain-containing protein 3-like isoform X2 [Patiria miniata]